MKIKDASDLQNHRQMEMPWGIMCLRAVFRETDKLDCGANCFYFNTPKMLAALRAPAIVLKKDMATTAHLPHKRLPLEQFTATGRIRHDAGTK